MGVSLLSACSGSTAIQDHDPLQNPQTSSKVQLQNLADSLYATSPWHSFANTALPEYEIHRAPNRITIDGIVNQTEWEKAQLSTPFVHIEGLEQPLDSSILKESTHVQMLWDDTHLYIAATLTEPHLWATQTEKNSIIFHENDFEVFLDPDGDNHHYHEIEINALNTIWELTLEKPYRDGGPYHIPHNLEGLETAVHLDGTLNDPSDYDRGWSVEMAIPFSELSAFSPGFEKPQTGTIWRLNFSRVEWPLEWTSGPYSKREGEREHNLVWSPIGIVDIHRPERWGIAVFSADAQNPPHQALAEYRQSLEARRWLMNGYYYAHHYAQNTGDWPPFIDPVQNALVSAQLQTNEASRLELRYTHSATGFMIEAHFTSGVEKDTRKKGLTVDQTGKIEPTY